MSRKSKARENSTKGNFHFQRLLVGMPSKKAIALIESVAHTHGFEVAETIDHDLLAPRQAETNMERRIILLRMRDQAITSDRTPGDGSQHVALSIRVIVCEVGSDISVMYFPDWETADMLREFRHGSPPKG